ncbi:hypothetical protein QTO34_018401 [Cnephaeus nilssonii]|uniref:non-specific serine/threonine protein kinase n=1 Tax=Cnephaeus nilssonii TaxID=3371016 RepID=A0AA40HYR2_CNENI|nr:hypothetical protein QTO34_018401 [Eptesicus nilssonii]
MGMNIKLADFGLSEVFMEDKLITVCGTNPYMAPELFLLEPYEGPKVDVWSGGIVLYKMLTGVLPFVGKNLEQLTEYILSGVFFIPYSLSVPCHKLLQKIINIDAGRRPTLEIIMQDHWVNTGQLAIMTPYIEPPCTDIDPQVTQIMRTLGYQKEEIEESLTGRKFNNIMGTYRILSMKLNIGARKIKVRPCSSSDSNMRLSRAQGMWASGKKGRDPVTPPPSPESNVSTPPGSLEWNSTTSSCSIRGKTTTPSESMPGTTTTPSGSVRGSTTSSPGSLEWNTDTPPIRVEVRRIIVQPGSAHLERTSQTGSTHLERTSQTGSTHWGTPASWAALTGEDQPDRKCAPGEVGQLGSAHGEKTSQTGSAHLESSGQLGSTHGGRTCQTGSAQVVRTGQPGSAHWQRTSQRGSTCRETTSQPGSRELRSQILHHENKVFPATQSSSSHRSCGGAPEGRNTDNCQAGPSSDGTTSPGQRQGRQGVARRVFGFFKNSCVAQQDLENNT